MDSDTIEVKGHFSRRRPPILIPHRLPVPGTVPAVPGTVLSIAGTWYRRALPVHK